MIKSKRIYLIAFLLFPKFISAQVPSLAMYEEFLSIYRKGAKDFVVMPYLAYTSLSLNRINLADSIARDYIDHYLMKMKGEAIYSMANIDFITQFTKSSEDKSFRLFYEQGEKVDQNIGVPGRSKAFVEYIIAKEEIDPRLWKDSDPAYPISEKPNWGALLERIKEKYTIDYAYSTIAGAKIRWYQFTKDSVGLAQSYFEKFERFGFDTIGVGKFETNNIIYNYIFRHATDTLQLAKAAKWMEVLVTADPQQAGFLDTYANLLYRLGKTSEALKWQSKAIALAPNDADIRTSWNRMKVGYPTWSSQTNGSK